MANFLLISADQWQAAPLLWVKGDADMDMQVWRRNDHGTKKRFYNQEGWYCAWHFMNTCMEMEYYYQNKNKVSRFCSILINLITYINNASW